MYKNELKLKTRSLFSFLDRTNKTITDKFYKRDQRGTRKSIQGSVSLFAFGEREDATSGTYQKTKV